MLMMMTTMTMTMTTTTTATMVLVLVLLTTTTTTTRNGTAATNRRCQRNQHEQAQNTWTQQQQTLQALKKHEVNNVGRYNEASAMAAALVRQSNIVQYCGAAVEAVGAKVATAPEIFYFVALRSLSQCEWRESGARAYLCAFVCEVGSSLCMQKKFVDTSE
uniref:Uncharacterized protein n=1 Tax=Bactrocera latifrons TaxID=174628 RepID=A0A0K8V792_BACLA